MGSAARQIAEHVETAQLASDLHAEHSRQLPLTHTPLMVGAADAQIH